MANHEWLVGVFEDIESYARCYDLTSVRDAVGIARKVAISEIADVATERDRKIISILEASQYEKFT